MSSSGRVAAPLKSAFTNDGRLPGRIRRRCCDGNHTKSRSRRSETLARTARRASWVELAEWNDQNRSSRSSTVNFASSPRSTS